MNQRHCDFQDEHDNLNTSIINILSIAYVSKWFPKEKQGTALGIFGAGNVGAAVTKFAARHYGFLRLENGRACLGGRSRRHCGHLFPGPEGRP